MGAIDAVLPPELEQRALVALADERADHSGEVVGNTEFTRLGADCTSRDEVDDPVSHHLLGAVAEQSLGARVEERDVAARVGHDDGHAGGTVDDAAHQVALDARGTGHPDVLPHSQHQRDDDDRTRDREGREQHPPRVDPDVVPLDDVGERATPHRGEPDRQTDGGQHLGERLEGRDAQRSPREDRDREEHQ